MMYTLNNFMPSFASPADKSADIEQTIQLGTAQDPEVTLATVMMTRLHDSRLQSRFHRLLLMDADGQVTSTYPLSRKINHIGRSRRNHVQIKDPLVSIKHLSISTSADKCVANDLDSSNGTFINGERLAGGQALNDGDEILLGKTVLQFAARQETPRISPPKARPVSRIKKKFYLSAAAVLCLAIAAAVVLKSTPLASGLLAPKALSPAGRASASSQPASVGKTAAPQLPVEAGGAGDLRNYQSPSIRTSYIQQALADYSAGRLDSAAQILNMLSAAREQTSEAFQARQMIALFSTVRKLHAQAQKARKEKKFAAAIKCWDRLLTVDMELVGDRPSYFAAQAELQVKILTYEYALEAYHSNNYTKARQLCRAVLQIDPKDQKALALLAKIDAKA